MGITMRGRFLIAGVFSLALAAIGCGDDGNDVGQFVGTWKYTTSNATFSCPSQPDQTGPLASMKHWGGGIKSDLVDLTTSCDYLFDVNDKKATIQKAQNCTFDDGSGAPATEVPSSWLFTLLSPSTAEETVDTVTTFSDGVACNLRASSTLEKISTN
jgi:hypothetical protein